MIGKTCQYSHLFSLSASDRGNISKGLSDAIQVRVSVSHTSSMQVVPTNPPTTSRAVWSLQSGAGEGFKQTFAELLAFGVLGVIDSRAANPQNPSYCPAARFALLFTTGRL